MPPGQQLASSIHWWWLPTLRPLVAAVLCVCFNCLAGCALQGNVQESWCLCSPSCTAVPDNMLSHCTTRPVLCLQATEQELWSLFSPIGNILELYILRGPNGLSRGCGFVTYANRYLAQQAIMQLNGKQVPPGKVLVVKLADRSLPSKPAAALPGSY